MNFVEIAAAVAVGRAATPVVRVLFRLAGWFVLLVVVVALVQG